MAETSTRLRKLNMTSPSNLEDDDEVERQLQADLNTQFSVSPIPMSLMKSSLQKRKSQNGENSVDGEKIPRKRNKNRKISTSFSQSIGEPKTKILPPTRKLLSSPVKNSIDHQETGSTITAPKLLEVTPMKSPHEATADEPASTIEQELSDKGSSTFLSLTRPRAKSLHDALLQTITRSCSRGVSQMPRELTSSPCPENIPEISSQPIKSESSIIPGNFTRPNKFPASRPTSTKPNIVPILPERHVQGPKEARDRFYCPLTSCKKRFKKSTGLENHMSTTHSDHQILPFTSVDEDSKKNSHCQKLKSAMCKSGSKFENTKFAIVSEDDEPLISSQQRRKYTSQPSLEARPVVSNHGNSHQISLSMEDWEVQPGILRGVDCFGDKDKGSEVNRDVAFSCTYINSKLEGVKLAGIEFNVERLLPGTLHTWNDGSSSLRVCSVAAGKVLVRINNNEFSIGAHGMWQIKRDEKCTIFNCTYTEAIIHISTIDDD